MKEQAETRHRGLHGGHVLLALLGGAAAGAAVAFLTAPRSGVESRQRLRGLAEEARDTVGRVPVAVKKATEAAREAFNEALDRANA
jgi:gas vesicle protein